MNVREIVVALSSDLKDKIQTGYRSLLDAKSFRPRPGQRQMIGTIASHLGAIEQNGEGQRQSPPQSLVIEAGTGTGKTAAYLLGALPVAEATGKTVVIATGTVALQGQLLDRDFPDLMQATEWPYTCAIAKGRRRYVCPLRLQQCQDAVAADSAGLLLFEDELAFPAGDKGGDETFKIIEDMAGTYSRGEWNGDRDDWPEAIAEATWRAVTVDRNQCAGYRCRMYGECGFYQARERLQEADCIVTNHDLLLADLQLGGGAILSEPEDTVYIIDEAHHFAATALGHYSYQSHINGTIQWLQRLEKTAAEILASLSGVSGIEHHLDVCQDMAGLAQQGLRTLSPLCQRLLDSLDIENGHYRFPLGELDTALQSASEQLATVFNRLAGGIEGLHGVLEAEMSEPAGSLPAVDIEVYFQTTGQWLGRAEHLGALWRAMARPSAADAPDAKWLTQEEYGDIRVSVSPIQAGPILREVFWQRAYATIATSATLRSVNSFDRFCRDTGLQDEARCLAMPPAFDYARAGILSIPEIGADGGSPTAHTAALIEHLPETLETEPGAQVEKPWGVLVLFASRRQMLDVAKGIEASCPYQLLVQGDYPVAEIIKRHRATVDAGCNSVIFGLASFAEGVDLPGRYCCHVVIAKLPFAVPDDPLNAALAEWLEARGLNAFRELSLPDASLRLIQACGRLLRSESDFGRVSILDRRLLSKSYGRELLAALPPFRRVSD